MKTWASVLCISIIAGLSMASIARAEPFVGATITPMIGSVGTDRLGGNGSGKSLVGFDLRYRGLAFDGAIYGWRIAEKLDDDAGISPRSGVTVSLDRVVIAPWRVGVLSAATDGEKLNYLTWGVGSRNADIAWLIPTQDATRFGLRVRLRAPLAGAWYGQTHYEYTGRQDPDIKIVTVGLGVGRHF